MSSHSENTNGSKKHIHRSEISQYFDMICQYNSFGAAAKQMEHKSFILVQVW